MKDKILPLGHDITIKEITINKGTRLWQSICRLTTCTGLTCVWSSLKSNSENNNFCHSSLAQEGLNVCGLLRKGNLLNLCKNSRFFNILPKNVLIPWKRLLRSRLIGWGPFVQFNKHLWPLFQIEIRLIDIQIC